MKKKLLIVGISFIVLVCLQIFSSGHEHVVVVEDNIQLNGENQQLTKANKTLTNSVKSLTEENKQLENDKQQMQQLVSEVLGDLDSTQSVIKQINKELENEKDINIKQSSGEQFDFQPIKLPTTDGN